MTVACAGAGSLLRFARDQAFDVPIFDPRLWETIVSGRAVTRSGDMPVEESTYQGTRTPYSRVAKIVPGANVAISGPSFERDGTFAAFT